VGKDQQSGKPKRQVNAERKEKDSRSRRSSRREDGELHRILQGSARNSQEDICQNIYKYYRRTNIIFKILLFVAYNSLFKMMYTNSTLKLGMD